MINVSWHKLMFGAAVCSIRALLYLRLRRDKSSERFIIGNLQTLKRAIINSHVINFVHIQEHHKQISFFFLGNSKLFKVKQLTAFHNLLCKKKGKYCLSFKWMVLQTFFTTLVVFTVVSYAVFRQNW